MIFVVNSSLHHGVFGQSSGYYCTLEGSQLHVPSTFLKASVQLPCVHWSVHGSYYTASVSCLHILPKTLQRLSLSTNPVCPHEHNFTRSLGANSDCDQCGQIFGFGTKNEIQNHGHTYKNTDSSGCFYPFLPLLLENFYLTLRNHQIQVQKRVFQPREQKFQMNMAWYSRTVTSAKKKKKRLHQF